MRQISDIVLRPEQSAALDEIRRRLYGEFDVESIIFYGSVARGEGDEESDQDLLILTKRPLSRPERHEITDMVFEVNLRLGTNFSTLVVDRQSWEAGAIAVLPVREEILRDGVLV